MFTFCSHFNSPIQKCFEYTFVRVSLEKVMGFDLSIEGTQPIVAIGKALPAPSNCRFAYGKTGGAFVATSGSLGLCFSVSMMRSNSSRTGLSHMIQHTGVGLIVD